MKKGVITIYLTITFTVLLSMFLAAFEAARQSAYRVVAESAFQSAVVSGFGEYHKELLSKYDLFFVDTTYQSGQVSENAIADHVSQYLNENLSVPEKRLLYAGDFFGDGNADVSVSSQRFATDRFGAPFKYQAAHYMEDLVSADFISDFTSLIRVKKEYSLDAESFEAIKERVFEEAGAGSSGEFIDAEEPSEEEASSDVDVQPDAEGSSDTELSEEEIKTIRSFQDFDMEYRYYKPLEWLVLKEEAAKKSAKIFNPFDVPSGRISTYKMGDGDLIQTKNSPVDEIFFTEYILLKCSNYTEEKEGSFLCYEAEYIIAGRDNDSENLGTVMENIFLIRTVANIISLKQDQEKTELIESVAAVLSAVTEVPQAAIEALIYCMWGAGESVYDMRDLLNGEKVSLIKDADDFRLSLNGGIKSIASVKAGDTLKLEDKAKTGGTESTGTSLSTEIGSYSAGGKSIGIDIKLSYEDYLRILIYLIPSELKTLRMMDVVELSIRQTENNELFRLDYCVDAAVFEVKIHTSFSSDYILKRRYSYF